MSERLITRRGVLAGGGAVAAAGIVGGVVSRLDSEPPLIGERLVVGRSPQRVPVDDPDSDAWTGKRVRIPLLPQQAVAPALREQTIPHIALDAIHDGEILGLRLSWDDEEVDDLNGLARFQDAVAVQIPTTAGVRPPVTMGGPGKAVHILQWRASWQRDLDSGRSGTAEVFPRVVRDSSPAELLPPATAELYDVGRAAGNPLSAAERVSPVEELVAEGFGSLTHLPNQRARGRGRHSGGGWTVAIGVPMRREGLGDPLSSDIGWPVAFAVWSGSAGNRGGRKHYTDWITVRLG